MNTPLLQLSPGLISFLQDLSVERAENEALELLPNNPEVSYIYGISSHLMDAVSLSHLPFSFPSLTTNLNGWESFTTILYYSFKEEMLKIKGTKDPRVDLRAKTEPTGSIDSAQGVGWQR